jgi:hypothetical protein
MLGRDTLGRPPDGRDMLGLDGDGLDMLGRDMLGLAPLPPTLPIDGRAPPPRPF